jgi:hypothetical protein
MPLSMSDGSDTGQEYVLECDGCPIQLRFSTVLDSQEHPKSAGWTRTPRDLCPECFAAARAAAMQHLEPDSSIRDVA